MAHGGIRKYKKADKPMGGGKGSKGLGAKSPLDKRKKKSKVASVKNQIRAIERLLKKGLPSAAQDVQKKRLEDLKKQAEEHHRAELERKMSLRYHGVKFFERRKIDRQIKRLEKLLDGIDATDVDAVRQKDSIIEQLAQLKEDLEYVRFFPRTEKYVSLFMGNGEEEVIAKRIKLREQIKANLAAAAASGVEPDEMYSDEGQDMAVSDDFFLAGSDDGETEDQFAPTNSSKPGASKDQVVKNIVKFSANHSSGHRTPQPYKSSQNSGASSKFHKQRPGPMSQNKRSWQDERSHFSKSANNWNKGSHSKDQLQHHLKSEENQLKDKIVSQMLKKANIAPTSNDFQSGYSKSQQTRHPSTSRGARRMESFVITSKNNVKSPELLSQGRVEAVKAPKVPEEGQSMDVQKKRRRKHRPKKKKA